MALRVAELVTNAMRRAKGVVMEEGESSVQPGDKTGNGSPPINPHMSQTLDPKIPRIFPHQAASTNIPYHNLSRSKLAPSVAGNITYHDLDSA